MHSWLIASLVVANLAMVVLSNVSFKFSALEPDWPGLLRWQVLGNLAGLASVVTFTIMLRHLSLAIAFGLSAGLGFVLVQVVGARLIFQEAVTSGQWLGVALVTAGIVLISQGRF